MYHRNIFGSPSEVLGNLRKSSDIFGNFRKFSENVRERSSGLRTILENLRKSSESGRKSSENHQKRRHKYAYIIKRTLHVSSKIWILCSRGKNNISLVRSAHSWDIVLATSNIKFISPSYCVISSMYFYYSKVSGIPSSNKLIKTIPYPDMWRYRWFRWYNIKS